MRDMMLRTTLLEASEKLMKAITMLESGRSEDVQQTSENGSERCSLMANGSTAGVYTGVGAVESSREAGVEHPDYEIPCDNGTLDEGDFHGKLTLEDVNKPATRPIDADTDFEQIFREQIQKIKVQGGAIEKCLMAMAGSNPVLLHKDIYGEISVTIPPDDASMDWDELETLSRSGRYPIGKHYMDILVEELCHGSK